MNKMKITASGVYLLFIKQIMENKLRYLLGASFITVFLSGFMMFYGTSRSTQLNSGDIHAIYQSAITVFGGIFTVSLFDSFNDKRRASWLALPVYAAERLASILIFSLLLFPVVFSALFAVSLTLTSCIYPIADPETLSLPYAGHDASLAFFLPRYLLCQTCIAICATYYRRYVYLKATLTVSLLFAFFLSYYNQTRDVIMDLPGMSADIEEVDVRDFPEKWKVDKTREVRLRDVAKDEQGRKTKQNIKERVAGSVGGTLYGFMFVSLATNESAIMPVTRYFHPRLNGELSLVVHRMFSAAFYIALVLGWVVVWLRLKESQL